MNLILGTHYSCERIEYTFMILREYTIYIPFTKNIYIPSSNARFFCHQILCEVVMETKNSEGEMVFIRVKEENKFTVVCDNEFEVPCQNE